MKVSVDVDCTPAEARAFLGLPDVTPIHDKYIQTMLQTFDGGGIEQMESILKNISPLGDASMRMFKQMFDLGLSSGGLGSKAKDK